MVAILWLINDYSGLPDVERMVQSYLWETTEPLRNTPGYVGWTEQCPTDTAFEDDVLGYWVG